MKKKRTIVYAIVICFAALTGWGYYSFNYESGYRRIDIRRTYPKGQWTRVDFVEIDFGQEWPALAIQGEKVKEFEGQFKQEIQNAEKCCVPWWYYYVLQPDQIRITTTKGKYCIPVLYGLGQTESLFGKTWRSESMRKLLYEWGYQRPDPCPPEDKTSNPQNIRANER